MNRRVKRRVFDAWCGVNDDEPFTRRVVQLSLLGSIFTNTLLVLGMAFLAGGLRHKEQTFNKQGVSLNAGLLLLSVVALALPATLQATNTNSINDSLHISRVSSVFLLVGYFGFLTVGGRGGGGGRVGGLSRDTLMHALVGTCVTSLSVKLHVTQIT